MPLVSRTFDQLIDFTRTSAATYVDASGRIVPTAASRNLLTFTQEFDNAVWAKANATIVANAAVAPDGTLTADKLAETAINGAFVMVQSPTMALNTVYSFSCYMKAAERSFGVLNIFTGTASCWTWYNLSTGTVSTLGAGATATITPAGNGWYRCTLTISTAASGSPNIAMWPSTANGVLTYTGTAGSGIYLWGAQLEAVPDANLVLGSELVSNGTFNTDLSGWAVGTDAAQVVPTWSAGSVTLTRGSGGISGFSQGLGLVSGRAYRVSFELISGNVSCGGGLPGFTTVTTLGVNTRVIVANGSNIQFWPTNTSSTAVIDNISVKEITGTTGMPTDYTRNNGGVYPPRFDYDPVTLAPKGLLVEEQRTNLLVRSEEFDNAIWTKAGVTVTANATTSPDGTVDADTVVEGTSNGQHSVDQSVALSASTTYAITFYAKRASGTRDAFIQVNTSGGTTGAGFAWFNLGTGVASAISTLTGTFVGISASATDVGNGWYRCTLVFTSNAGNAGAVIFFGTYNANRIYTGDGTSALYIWGAQLEAGAFATSYIPTVASQVTRTADVATITGANFSQWYNPAAGTFVVEFDKASAAARGGALSAADFNAVSGTGVTIDGQNDANIRAFIENAGVVQMLNATLLAYSANATVKAAVAYATNDAVGAAGGQLGTADTTVTVPTLNALQVGAVRNTVNAATNFLNGHIRSIRYYPTRLSNAQLQALTA